MIAELFLEPVGEWLLSSGLLGYFRRKAARRRFARVLSGGAVELPGFLRMSPAVPRLTEVKFVVGVGRLGACPVTGLPQEYALDLEDVTPIVVHGEKSRFRWRDEPAILLRRQDDVIADIYCRPQDVATLSLALEDGSVLRGVGPIDAISS